MQFRKPQYAQKARKASAEELIFYGQQMVVKPVKISIKL
jgi:hypothetical protein